MLAHFRQIARAAMCHDNQQKIANEPMETDLIGELCHNGCLALLGDGGRIEGQLQLFRSGDQRFGVAQLADSVFWP